MQAAKRGVLHSAEWKALLDGNTVVYRKLSTMLDANDISPLIELCTAGPEEQKAPAFYLLYRATIKQLSMTEEQRRELIALLTRMMAAYPDPSGMDAFAFLYCLAQPLAERFLLNEIDASRIAEDKFSSYLRDLMKIESVSVMDVLLRYSKLEGLKGEKAKLLLKARGVIDPQEIRGLGEQWRSSKSEKYLNDLCAFHIQYQHGKPIAPLLELLGPPNRHESHEYWYQSADGFGVFLLEGTHGNVKLFKQSHDDPKRHPGSVPELNDTRRGS